MVTSVRLLSVVSLAGAMGLATASLQAAIVIDPIGATASSHYDANTVELNTINGSGLVGSQQAVYSVNPLPTGTAVPGTWLATGKSNDGGGNIGENGYRWHANAEATPTITFDLGAAYDVTGFHLWNMNQNATGVEMGRSIKTADLSVSLDGITYTPVTGPATFTQALGTDTYQGEDYSITASNIRYVKFAVTANWGGAGPYTGMDEIRFIGTTVPEPTSLGFISLGAMALLRRRRRA